MRQADFHQAPGIVRGDPNRLQQVFWNLLSNAVKFTPKGGKVQVSLEQVSSHVEITVTDTGVGIPAEFLPFVFDRFSQVDSTATRRHGGLGLGLSIVKQLVELHGGSIQARSPGEGQGSTFVISLPVAAVHLDDNVVPQLSAVANPPLGGCTPDLAGLRILVVDDEPDACGLVVQVLANCKGEVDFATSADEGLRLVQLRHYHVLISDIGMPGKDGYAFIREVRELGTERGGGNIPALALTAFARSEDRQRAALAGFQNHLAKPVEAMELLAVVANLAGRTGR